GNTQVIMTTSSMSGEGKTFFCINLSASLAITGKRVAMLEFDIRRPRVLKDLGVAATKPGITNYVVDGALKLEDLLIPSSQVEGLSFIGAGPIPPNPAELLTHPRINELFAELRETFDYILVDTS